MNTRPLLAAALALLPLAARANDWPQWRGPNRDGHSRETGLLKEWPKDGPKELWKAADLGTGYSTPSVAGGRIYLCGAKGDEECCITLNEADGKPAWTVKLGKVGPNKGPQYPGARSTPTVDGELLYALGSDGDLVCLESATGKERWRKNYKSDLAGKMGM